MIDKTKPKIPTPENRKGSKDRRKKLRSPFTDRRKRNFIEVYRYELNKLFIPKQQKQIFCEQIKKFISHFKTSPRQLHPAQIENYLQLLPENIRKVAARSLNLLYCQLYAYQDYDILFQNYQVNLKPKIKYASYLHDMIQQLRIENKSRKTIKLYKNNLIRLFDYYKNKKLENITINVTVHGVPQIFSTLKGFLQAHM